MNDKCRVCAYKRSRSDIYVTQADDRLCVVLGTHKKYVLDNGIINPSELCCS